MKLISLVESVMTRMAVVPGFQFLGRYVAEIQHRRTVVKQVATKYGGYVHSARGAAAEVKQAVATEQQPDDDEEEVEEEDDDFETFMQ
jgi:hypothetical protein